MSDDIDDKTKSKFTDSVIFPKRSILTFFETKQEISIRTDND